MKFIEKVNFAQKLLVSVSFDHTVFAQLNASQLGPGSHLTGLPHVQDGHPEGVPGDIHYTWTGIYIHC